jgi:hypothetical protein
LRALHGRPPAPAHARPARQALKSIFSALAAEPACSGPLFSAGTQAINFILFKFGMAHRAPPVWATRAPLHLPPAVHLRALLEWSAAREALPTMEPWKKARCASSRPFCLLAAFLTSA